MRPPARGGGRTAEWLRARTLQGGEPGDLVGRIGRGPFNPDVPPLEVLVFPDPRDLLDPLDRIAARPEGLAAPPRRSALWPRTSPTTVANAPPPRRATPRAPAAGSSGAAVTAKAGPPSLDSLGGTSIGSV